MPKRQHDAGLLEALKAQAQEQQLSVLRLIINKRIINFQNYDNLKRAFSGAYGLSLSNIGLTSTRIARLKTFIKYRHVIVHVSPMLGMLNGSDVPPNQPEFVNEALATEAISCFDEFVKALHRASLNLRPST